MRPKENKESPIIVICLLGAILYTVSILWINFHGKQWYTFDIYSDALLSRIMVEQGTIFPDNWVFGNQFYVVATPVLAAGVFAICHNSVLAMSIASSTMMFAIMLCFVWAVKPFANKKSGVVGLFCLSGAIILGSSASSYTNGLQYFYTMASFYSCYIFAILFTLGTFFRMRTNRKCNPATVGIGGVLSFALGMQSLRALLVLYLPLCAFVFLMYICKKGEGRSTLYILALTVIDVAGVIVMKFVPTKSAPIIGDVSLTVDPTSLIGNFKSASSALLTITGLNFFGSGLKWLPLFAAALFIFGIVMLALVGVIKNRCDSVLGGVIMFCTISLLAVYFVGIFLFRVRSVYFFVWYLLVVFSFMYVVQHYVKISRYVAILLCVVGTLNYITNFYPDFSQYSERDRFFRETTEELVDGGINCVYVDVHTSPVFAAYSNDKIVSGTVHLDPTQESGGLMYPVSCLEPLDVFENAKEYNAYIVFSNWTFDYLERSASDEYVDELFSELEFVKGASYAGGEFSFYRFSPETLNVR